MTLGIMSQISNADNPSTAPNVLVLSHIAWKEIRGCKAVIIALYSSSSSLKSMTCFLYRSKINTLAQKKSKMLFVKIIISGGPRTLPEPRDCQ